MKLYGNMLRHGKVLLMEKKLKQLKQKGEKVITPHDVKEEPLGSFSLYDEKERKEIITKLRQEGYPVRDDGDFQYRP